LGINENCTPKSHVKFVDSPKKYNKAYIKPMNAILKPMNAILKLMKF